MEGANVQAYFTHKVRNSLSLPILKQQRMLIKTFGSERKEEHVCDIVRIGLKTVCESGFELSLFSVPLIYEPQVSHQPIGLVCKPSYDHLASLDIADLNDSHTNLRIDILIRSDHYWKIVTGDVVIKR